MQKACRYVSSPQNPVGFSTIGFDRPSLFCMKTIDGVWWLIDPDGLSLPETERGLRRPVKRLIVSPMCELFAFIWCCPSRIFRFGRTDGEVHPKPARIAHALPSGRHAGSVRPCPAIGAYEIRCNIVCRN
jgi:hypothetical protein